MKLCKLTFFCPSQLLQLLLLSSLYFRRAQLSSLGNETDRLALLHFKEKVTSDPMGFLSSWNDFVPHCNWSGVICNKRHLRVAKLIIEGRKLSGSISTHIGNLSFLRSLDLQNNSFHGAIPQQVGNLFRLQYLLLGNNTLGGEIPVNLTSCFKLKRASLQWNNLSGKIPPQLGSLLKLEMLALNENSLTGMIPPSLGNLSSLQRLTMSDNKLEGNIPGELIELKQLFVFSVAVNDLSGIIPPFLFNISSIELLSFTANKFYGGLPDKGFNLPHLRIAEFGGNQLTGNLPNSLTNASQLQLLDISSNNFVGQIPSNVGDLSRLTIFDIAKNNLGRNSTKDLDFLASLTRCRELRLIDFSANNLGGVLPAYVANFSTQLNLLYAGSNQIFGRIPPTLENLTNLILLGLEYCWDKPIPRATETMSKPRKHNEVHNENKTKKTRNLFTRFDEIVYVRRRTKPGGISTISILIKNT